MPTLEEQISAAEADLALAKADLAQAKLDPRSTIEYLTSLTNAVAAVNNRLTALTTELTRRSSLSGATGAGGPAESKKRGVAVPISDDGSRLFEVNDPRIRIECNVSNNNNVSFDMEALCYGGASRIELTLPPRKIIQLGLEPFGKPTKSKGSANDTALTMKFKPPVLVKMKFLRDNEEFEVRERYLHASCHLVEYETEKERFSAGAEGDSTGQRTLSGVKRKASDMSDSSVSRDCNSNERVSIKLSPVTHRPPSNPDQRVVLGQKGLAEFSVVANFQNQVLEIEEEDEIEYEE